MDDDEDDYGEAVREVANALILVAVTAVCVVAAVQVFSQLR